MRKKTARKLHLKSSSVRLLTADQLGAVNGGIPTTTTTTTSTIPGCESLVDSMCFTVCP